MSQSARYRAIMAEIGTLNEQVKSVFDKAGNEDVDRATYQQVVTNNKKIEELELEAKEILDAESARDAATRRAVDLKAPQARLGTVRGDAPAIQTIGEQFVNDAAFKQWLAEIAPNGRVPDRVKVQSPAVQLKTLLTGTSSTSAGALVVNERKPIIDMGTSYRPINVLDLLTGGTTSSDTVEYVREGTHTNNAAPTAEATATGDGTGAKPESAMALSIVTEAVKTIAHWIPATRRALADAGQLRTLIDNFLRYGLREELVDQVLNGSGVGENFTGIYNTSGTSTQAYDTDLLTTTRKARTKVMTSGRATPTAFVMHPTDWEAFDLLQDNEARYFFGGPSALGQPRLWGLPVVEEEANTAGAALVADWRLVVLWDREMAQIMMSDSHSDFFIRNLVAILGEMRAAFGVLRPAAFVEIDLTP